MLDFSVFAHADAWVALLTLTLMEIVLGIDNIVFLSISTGTLPKEQRPRARTLGLAGALVMRIGLLFTITWVMGLEKPLFTLLEQSFSWRDLILGAGGLFLLAKSVQEIFNRLEEADGGAQPTDKHASLVGVIIQVTVLDIVFSLDSVITAVGMAEHLSIMAVAVVIAVVIMLVFAGAISEFINGHPSMKVLALSFLLLIGVMLVAEAMHQHIEKGYIYFAMSFALMVELINLRTRKRTKTAGADRLEDRHV